MTRVEDFSSSRAPSPVIGEDSFVGIAYPWVRPVRQSPVQASFRLKHPNVRKDRLLFSVTK